MTIDGETIETTKEHQFWVEGQGWTKAKFLKAGDQLRDDDGNSVIINKVEIVSLPKNQYTIVYNLEVADFHTYYVADSYVLVHNVCDVDSYKKLKKTALPGEQVHHIGQDKAFGSVVPHGEAICVKLNGNIRLKKDRGSSHYKAHQTLESFWDNYRKGGKYYGTKPTIQQYNKAAYKSLINAGISQNDAVFAMQKLFKQQTSYNLYRKSKVPNVPGSMNYIRR